MKIGHELFVREQDVMQHFYCSKSEYDIFYFSRGLCETNKFGHTFFSTSQILFKPQELKSLQQLQVEC